MRAVAASGCSGNLNPNGILAIVTYTADNTTNGASPAEPTSTPFNIASMECVDETGLVPVVPKNVGNLAIGNQMDIDTIQSNYFKFIINDSSLFIDWDNPTLLMVDNLNPSFPGDYNIISLNGTADTVPEVTEISLW